jgi:AcrR family transcriptional regulator
MAPPSSPRPYSRAARDAQIARSRRSVIAAADACFLEVGFAGTTVARVAATAGVSVQTVYNVVGGKAELLKAAYDRRVAGDDEPVPVAERPQVRAITSAPTARAALHAYAAMGRELGERTVQFLARLLPEAGSDPAMRAFAETIERERAIGATNVARHVDAQFGLRPRLTVEHAADMLWALTAPELADRLVHHRTWGWDLFQQWLGDTMTDVLAAPTITGANGRAEHPRSEDTT